MALLIAGIVLFFGIHLMPSIGDTREKLLAKYGRKGYMPLIALPSLLGFVLIVYGKAHAEFIPVWQPPAGMRHATYLLVTLALIAFAARLIPSNIRRWLGHPVLWAVALWGIGHLLANGDLASMLLFGAFTVYSIYAFFSLKKRKPWPAVEKKPIWRDIVVVILGLLLFGVILMFHQYIAGVPLIG